MWMQLLLTLAALPWQICGSPKTLNLNRLLRPALLNVASFFLLHYIVGYDVVWRLTV